MRQPMLADECQVRQMALDRVDVEPVASLVAGSHITVRGIRPPESRGE